MITKKTLIITVFNEILCIIYYFEGFARYSAKTKELQNTPEIIDVQVTDDLDLFNDIRQKQKIY